jgi:hypothetical protein
MSFRRMRRTISFRVSEDEFKQLRSKSEATGARSVSDYARLSLCGTAPSNGQHEMKIQELSDGIQRLSMDIRLLFEMIEAPQRNQNGHNAIAAKQNGGADA